MKIHKYIGRYNISGKNIKVARERCKLSQEQLAAKLQLAGLSLTQKAISRIETGERVVADFELQYFAAVLGVKITWLLSTD